MGRILPLMDTGARPVPFRSRMDGFNRAPLPRRSHSSAPSILHHIGPSIGRGQAGLASGLSWLVAT
jgi:hypothetical protein